MTHARTRRTFAAMNAPKLALTLLTTALLALSACGGGGSDRLSPTAYKQRLSALSRQDNKVHANVDNLPHSKSVAQMEAGLAAFATGEQRLGTQVAALKPPKNAQAANAQLAKGFEDSASEMKRVQAALAPAKTPKQALTILGKLGPQLHGGKELDSALAQLKKLGYATSD
jgi:hypothetical protein